jgi:uncharacterized protein YndB with AHSA1/START domain
MKLRERVTIRGIPEEIWPLIADPAREAEWNPKLIAVDRQVAGPVRLGERFKELFQMGGRDRESDCEIVELEHPSSLVVRHRPAQWTPDRFVYLRYRLQAVSRGTRVVQEIDFTHSGIAWYFQLLMWIIHRTGTTEGKPYLESLKEIVERGSD